MNKTTKSVNNRNRNFTTDEYDSIPNAIEIPPDDEDYDSNFEVNNIKYI